MNKKLIWTGSVLAVLVLVAIILSIVALVKINTSKTENYKTFEKKDHTVVFCNATIWEDKTNNALYCASKKTQASDVEWDGKYPDNYFNN